MRGRNKGKGGGGGQEGDRLSPTTVRYPPMLARRPGCQSGLA